MRKKVFLIVIVIIAIILLIPEENNEFRIRVIANSDSSADQNEKMAVVSALQKRIAGFDQNDIAGEVIANIDILEADVKRVLCHDNYLLSIKKIKYPAKTINGRVIPGGKYRTLLVVIGKGEGKNWWSLLYPDYHGISFEDAESGDIEYEFYFWEKLKKLLLGG